MRVISNALLSQAEITQIDRWHHGPLELQFLPTPGYRDSAEFELGVVDWNRNQCSGLLRSDRSQDFLQSLGLQSKTNPNFVFVPTVQGYSELLGMIGSLLPDRTLVQHNIKRPVANFWLWPLMERIHSDNPEELLQYSDAEIARLTKEHFAKLASIIPLAFEQWIWTKLVAKTRFSIQHFAKNSSLRILAGDIRFWMHRLYRIAIDLYEDLPPADYEDKTWRPLDDIQRDIDSILPQEERRSYQVTRPRIGGYLWDSNDLHDREFIAQLLIDGNETMTSLEPVMEVLLGSSTHEDFSSRYSWVKEDFERAFYSKRSKIKVKLFECIDACSVRDGSDTPGYDDILFRDVMAIFSERDRTIILALRQGKTQSEIAEQLGHSGHAAVSRRIKIIKNKMQQILRNK